MAPPYPNRDQDHEPHHPNSEIHPDVFLTDHCLGTDCYPILHAPTSGLVAGLGQPSRVGGSSLAHPS